MVEEKEVWVPLIEFEGKYEVSNFGRVKNVKRNYILSRYKTDRGYEHLTISTLKGKKKTIRTAKWVWESFNNCKCKDHVDHIDRNKQNNNINNLRCIPGAENSKNKSKQNRYNISASIKGEIIRKYKSGEWNVYKIWKLFGIPTNYLYSTIKRGSWDKYANKP